MEVFEMKLKKKSFFDEDDENLDPERRKMNEEQKAKENELFIQLFYPLSRKQKLEIWKIWENTINEDTFIRKKEIKDYCEENKCDFLTALCSILFKIHYLYRCTYILDDGTIVSKYLSLCYPEFENLKSFLEERYIKYLNNGNPITEEQRETYNLMIEYINMERFNLEFDQSVELLRLVDPMRIFTFKYIHYEEIELKKMIEKLSKDRQNNPDEYINDKLKDSVKWKDAHFKISHQGHIKDMYYPVSKIETEKSNIEISTNEEVNQLDNKKSNKLKKESPKVEIDIEALKLYFKPSFTAISDNSNFDTFINDLRGALPTYKSKDIATISLLIYESDKLHNSKKPSTFSKWFAAFCIMINYNNTTCYKPCKLRENMKKHSETFYYL